MPWCTNQLRHVQNLPNSKLSCTKNFMVFNWGHLEAFPTLTSQKPRNRPSSYAVVHRPTWPRAKLSELKTFVHQEFHGNHLGAFGGQSKPHISNTTNFKFSQNSPPSYLAMPWCTNQLRAKPSELKTFVHQLCRGAPPTLAMCKTLRTQNFRAPRLSWYSFGAFLGHSNPHISKTTNFMFAQNSPPSLLAMPRCTANIGHVQNPPNSKLSCTKTFMVFIWAHF
ncbi:hypothetical protein DEO72_LG5g2275 [Vigna unguiculata]|uniref:Uncharacterized protein n=1 Tax=Vigna unguiculata TaxID=3917 RepID=A0A4D6M2C8_VIGUN|nr:hypothetical protein DEO72_LG5g2275 [Vigna unguiculata]